MTENSQGGQDAAARAGNPAPGADESRSGADVGEAVQIAESGTNAEGDHSHPERAKSGEAPVEQVFNDSAMTQGQRTVTDSAKTNGTVPPGPPPAKAGSGGAQSVVGARESDRLAGGEQTATGKPFDTGTGDAETGDDE
ncbi:hypothetical protein [Arthrobacter sp. NPDC058192]|uniref:hypothetical protein n=1 Tax=Arthrobacter sp. NPDC058192 TaxID=3346372 RepID=UPI0036ED044E